MTTEKELEYDIGKEYLEILRDPKLWDSINRELDKRIVGEERARKTIFLVANGKNVINSDKTSFNLMVDSESGAGKDWIVRNTLKILPHKETVMLRSMTPKAPRWMKRGEEDYWTWDKKVLYIEDCPNDVLNDDTFKTMSSSDEETSAVVESTDKGVVASELKVRGKPVMIITTANPFLKKEMVRRFGSLNVDESAEQTKAIIKKKLELAEKGEVEGYDPKIICALKCLKRERVIIPWAGRLESHVPDSLILRTALNRFLDFIKSACVFYQFQRERDGKGFLIAQKEDYEFAVPCFQSIISTKWLTLSKKEKKVLDIVKEKNDEIAGLSVIDIEPHTPFIRAKQTLYNILNHLTELNLLKLEYQERSESKKPVMVWKLRESGNSVSLPTWEDLMKN